MNMFLFYRYLWALVGLCCFRHNMIWGIFFRYITVTPHEFHDSNYRELKLLTQYSVPRYNKGSIKTAPFWVEMHRSPVVPHKGPEMREITDAIVFTFTSFIRSTLASGPSSVRIKAMITATMIVICVPRGVIIGVPWTCRQFRAPLCVIDRSYSLYISMTPCEVAQIKCQCWHLVHS